MEHERRRGAGMRATAASRELGFTYLMALFMLAAMGVALAALGEAWHTTVTRDKEAHLLFVGNQFRRGIESYFGMVEGSVQSYPRSLEDLIKDQRTPAVRRHLRRVFIDPMTGRAEWGLVMGPQGELIGVHSLHEGRPIKVSRFDPVDAAFEGKQSYREWQFVFLPPNAPSGLIPVPAGADPQRPGSPGRPESIAPGTAHLPSAKAMQVPAHDADGPSTR